MEVPVRAVSHCDAEMTDARTRRVAARTDTMSWVEWEQYVGSFSLERRVEFCMGMGGELATLASDREKCAEADRRRAKVGYAVSLPISS